MTIRLISHQMIRSDSITICTVRGAMMTLETQQGSLARIPRICLSRVADFVHTMASVFPKRGRTSRNSPEARQILLARNTAYLAGCSSDPDRGRLRYGDGFTWRKGAACDPAPVSIHIAKSRARAPRLFWVLARVVFPGIHWTIRSFCSEQPEPGNQRFPISARDTASNLRKGPL